MPRDSSTSTAERDLAVIKPIALAILAALTVLAAISTNASAAFDQASPAPQRSRSNRSTLVRPKRGSGSAGATLDARRGRSPRHAPSRSTNNGRAERSEPGIMAFDGYEPRFGGPSRCSHRPVDFLGGVEITDIRPPQLAASWAARPDGCACRDSPGPANNPYSACSVRASPSTCARYSATVTKELTRDRDNRH